MPLPLVFLYNLQQELGSSTAARLTLLKNARKQLACRASIYRNIIMPPLQCRANLYMLEMMRRIVRTGLWIVSAVCVFFGMTTSPAQAAAPSPRANGRIYFRDNNPATSLPGIFAMDADATNKTLISPNIDNNQFDRVSISPDGKKIVFQQLDTLGGGTGSIVTANADGSDLQTIVPVTPAIDVLYPIWSPDGSKIAYLRYDSGTTGVSLHTINPDGTGNQVVPIALSNNPFVGSLYPVAWSSNNVLAYIDNDDLYTANLDGSNVANLTEESGWMDAYPSSVAWSPNGSKLAFSAALCPGVVDENGLNMGCIATMNADGSDKTVVVRAIRPAPNCSLSPLDVSWSPDGKKLIYSKEQGCVI